MFRGDIATLGGRALAWTDALLIDHAIFRLFWSNFAVVTRGRLYRSNHPTPGRLTAFTRRYGIATLISLRGRTNNGSDALSRDMAARLGLDFVDMPMESRRPPQRDRIVQLHRIYQSMREPGLIHCKSGADRAGIAAALFILFQGGTVAEAMRQLSWRFGHLKRARAGILDAFLLRYAREGEPYKPFLEWVREDYDEAALARDFRANGLASFINDWVLAHE
ncbi:MAG: tyrosine-protein phosphatase [Acetobacteraceae bacterium]|nr:tyrosine-protein phosphatase [Acetobacteraceae bacterium]